MATENTSDENDTSIGSMLDDLIKKYGLAETADEMYKKIISGTKPNRAVVGELLKKFTENKITEENMISVLQKNFPVATETAQYILTDIKNTLSPYFRKVLESRSKNSTLKIDNKNFISSPPKKVRRFKNINNKNRKINEPGERVYKEIDKYREQI